MARILTTPQVQRGEGVRGNPLSSSRSPGPANSVSKLLHAPVCTGSGKVVGDVDDMLINCTTGRIEYLWIRTRIEMGGMCVRLSWADVKLDFSSDQFIIVPGGSAVKRLLIRTGTPNKEDAMH